MLNEQRRHPFLFGLNSNICNSTFRRDSRMASGLMMVVLPPSGTRSEVQIHLPCDGECFVATEDVKSKRTTPADLGKALTREAQKPGCRAARTQYSLVRPAEYEMIPAVFMIGRTEKGGLLLNRLSPTNGEGTRRQDHGSNHGRQPTRSTSTKNAEKGLTQSEKKCIPTRSKAEDGTRACNSHTWSEQNRVASHYETYDVSQR
ncbi:hypothetical protein C8Q79DRAFT_234244 [Trametes meyenii]|nr:hypothetical protein C8Q79DRAFT_234244 [Trametes meyenii]